MASSVLPRPVNRFVNGLTLSVAVRELLPLMQRPGVWILSTIPVNENADGMAYVLLNIESAIIETSSTLTISPTTPISFKVTARDFAWATMEAAPRLHFPFHRRSLCALQKHGCAFENRGNMVVFDEGRIRCFFDDDDMQRLRCLQEDGDGIAHPMMADSRAHTDDPRFYHTQFCGNHSL